MIVAINEATAEVKYFLSNAVSTAVAQLVAVAFCRWNVEYRFRLAKQEAGLMHYEGRAYTGLMRHWMWALVVLGFGAPQTERLRGGKNPRVTAAQVCRALNQRCVTVLRRRRRVPERRPLSEVISYHQRRIRASDEVPQETAA
jgi:hypothetical protein